METTKAVLIQNATLLDIEKMVNRAVEARMDAFCDRIRPKSPVLIKRKEAASILEISLPTLDKYAKIGWLHPVHVGGRVYYDKDELSGKIAGEPLTNISPLPSRSHSHETP